jgi:hypothetical protein
MMAGASPRGMPVFLILFSTAKPGLPAEHLVVCGRF